MNSGSGGTGGESGGAGSGAKDSSWETGDSFYRAVASDGETANSGSETGISAGQSRARADVMETRAEG